MLSKNQLKEMSNELIEFDHSLLDFIQGLEEVTTNDMTRFHIRVHHAYMDLYGENNHDESFDLAKWMMYFHEI